MDLQNIVFLGFVAVWLVGLAWASIVVIKAKGTKREKRSNEKTDSATKRRIDRNVES
ncbi:hypothetical protein [Streptococcus rubneri]|uniref:hypothetical protein n=1 Tax=Streptococcus rubneri TaxID=1234680 RepID=UPI00189CE34C|nr:hypothetical protein [Streptococcus rubneri]